MSIPVQDHTPAGILEVTRNFYEFIPAGQIDRPDPDCLRSHQVQQGQEYFIVLTNSAGLYRYSIGDLVRVVGFEGQAPVVEFFTKLHPMVSHVLVWLGLAVVVGQTVATIFWPKKLEHVMKIPVLGALLRAIAAFAPVQKKK